MRMGCPVGPTAIYKLNKQLANSGLEEFKDVFLFYKGKTGRPGLHIHKEKLTQLIMLAKEQKMINVRGRLDIKNFVSFLKGQKETEAPKLDKPSMDTFPSYEEIPKNYIARLVKAKQAFPPNPGYILVEFCDNKIDFITVSPDIGKKIMNVANAVK